MSQINVSGHLRSNSDGRLHEAPRFLAQHRVDARSPLCGLLRCIREVWQDGGGILTSRVLVTDYGVYLSDAELSKAIETLCASGMLTQVADVEKFGHTSPEFELSDRGARLAVELDWLLSREISRDE